MEAPAYYVEYHQPGGWTRVAEFDHDRFTEAVEQFELTVANAPASMAVRLVAPAEK